MSGQETISNSMTAYVRRVSGAISESTRQAAAARTSLTGTLPPSHLEGRTRLEDAIDDLVASGGKLIRPAMLFLGYLAVAGSGPAGLATPADPATSAELAPCVRSARCARIAAAAAGDADLVRLGCALELLHVFGLLQDDVMDEAATRRGAPTARHAFGRSHQVTGSHGDAGRFGDSAAILAGDLAFALAQRQLRGLPDPVARAWDDMVLELVQGQRLDLIYAAEGRFDPDTTRTVAQAKSGAYSVARPLELGALLACPDAEPPDWLREFGAHLGAAFALADDLLGVFGDPVVTGKPVADDIRQRKPTTVLGIAEEVLRGGVSALLGPHRPAPTEAQIQDLRTDMAAAGVADEAELRLCRHVHDAEAALNDRCCAPVCAEFVGMARRLARRPA